MPPTAELRPAADPQQPWRPIVAAAAAWLDAQGIAARDAIVLVPFAQHLPLARAEWARRGGWLPRIETTQTLARSLGPAPAGGAEPLSGEAALDRLRARALLRSLPHAWARLRRDPGAIDHAAAAVAQTAHGIARAAAAVPPAARDAHWSSCRAALAGAGGAGGTERLLAGIALEWAAAQPPPATDALFDLHPAAWIAVQAGGPDALARGVLRASADRVPTLVLDTDAAPESLFDDLAARAACSVAVCTDFEDEAQRSAARILAHLRAGTAPVALVAQDRLLARRVRALLARSAVPIRDETGWKLSTTRAGASVVALLRAARRDAGADAWLDWLKASGRTWPGLGPVAGSLDALELALRARRWSAPRAVDADKLDPRARALWSAAGDVLRPFAERGAGQRLSGWLAALRTALQACGSWDELERDEAGRQLVWALHLAEASETRAGDDEPMALDAFTRWADAALEDAPYVPLPPDDAPVVITPLERAMLRPFGAVVFPGADEKRLGASPLPHPLLSNAQLAALGMPDAGSRRHAETLAFVQALRLPAVTLLRRADDGGEPLAPSPLLARFALAAAAAGRPLADAADAREAVAVAPVPVEPPQPSAPDLLPDRLSATTLGALRTCPYSFFALDLLDLRYPGDELDDEIDKRDYGTWLHAVLHRYHQERREPLPREAEIEALRNVGVAVQRDMHHDDAVFLPWLAAFDRFVPRYVDWLLARDAAGARWVDGERTLTARPEAWGGVAMKGVIDRIDRLGPADGGAIQLIDYKTVASTKLKDRLKRPQEDTQLAFYAALHALAEGAGTEDELEALYLAIDDPKDVVEVRHADAAANAERLVAEVGRELDRIRASAALPALGTGAACGYCEVRGLCRRDLWPDAPR